MYANIATTVSGCVASGNGKTFIVIGIANIHVLSGDKVVVVVTDDMLLE